MPDLYHKSYKAENYNEVMLVQNFVDSRDVRHFVKWAGGKSQLLLELDKLITSQFNRYFEPFLGGGAVFLRLASKNMISTAYLSDTNKELIKVFKVVSDSVGELITVLNEHQKEYNRNPSEHYYRLRELIQPRLSVFVKTCFRWMNYSS
jgi:DNA adenine methylase Dam